jgi:hypothetical protein
MMCEIAVRAHTLTQQIAVQKRPGQKIVQIVSQPRRRNRKRPSGEPFPDLGTEDCEIVSVRVVK